MRTLKFSALAISAVAIALGLSACSIFGDNCKAGNMRCHGNVAQMCDSNNQWTDWQNCSSVGERCGNGPDACSGFDVACCN